LFTTAIDGSADEFLTVGLPRALMSSSTLRCSISLRNEGRILPADTVDYLTPALPSLSDLHRGPGIEVVEGPEAVLDCAFFGDGSLTASGREAPE
jgi:hypothetical protein